MFSSYIVLSWKKKRPNLVAVCSLFEDSMDTLCLPVGLREALYCKSKGKRYAEATGSNPVEALPKTFFRATSQLLKIAIKPGRSHLHFHIPAVHNSFHCSKR